jgi:hypothetical protein
MASGDLSRSEVILKGAIAAGAVYGVGMVGPFVRNALAMSDGGDVGVLNFALAFEQMESAFYKGAYAKVRGGKLDLLIGLLADYEPQHVTALTASIGQLGGKPAPAPTFDFTYSDDAGLLRLAQMIEDTAVGAYNGLIPLLKDKEALVTAAAIAQVEGRFAAMVRQRNGVAPAPDAFDPALDESQVREAMKPFIQ